MPRSDSQDGAGGSSPEALINDITEQTKRNAKEMVPWFLDNMPRSYFRQVEPELQKQHLYAIAALCGEGIVFPEVMLRGAHEDQLTFMSSGKVGIETVSKQISVLPASSYIRRVLLFTTDDERLSLNTYDTTAFKGKRFSCSAGASDEELGARARLLEHVSELELDEPTLSSGEIEELMGRCSSAYVCSHVPRLLYKQLCLYKRVTGSDKVVVDIETDADGPDWSETEVSGTLLTCVLPGVTPKAALRRVLLLLEMHDVDLHRAQVDTIDDPSTPGGYVTLVRTIFRRPGEQSVHQAGHFQKGGDRRVSDSNPVDFAAMKRNAIRLKWVDDPALSLAARSSGNLSLVQAEVMFALVDLSLSVLDHPLLSRTYVHDRLQHQSVQPHAKSLASLFLSRFDPTNELPEVKFLQSLSSTLKSIESRVEDEPSRQLLRAMANGVRCTMRTNAFMRDRWALTLRLDPDFFESVLPPSPAALSNRPYGVFFICGRHFNGYHVRFTDIARGGLRLVLPPSADAHTVESRRHFNEAFSLAWAQTLKNKDIPEGGAKAVCLIYPVQGEERAALLHSCMKKFVDGLLDLIAPVSALEHDGGAIISRGCCASELIYLGPDENITPIDIDWIADRAAERRYALPSAFISSKPRAGINHKEFGVTSEGVAVFLHEGLRAIGIDTSTQSFTVKLTGGPDGDVAGNMIRILHRRYGEQVHIVGIADGTGCAEDPDGLPMVELLRCVKGSLPINMLDKSLLSPRGTLSLADTPEGAARRNTMHNRVVADAFVPAGGRPSTINVSNWHDYLLPDGRPSSRIIVEGANLFLTADARKALFEATGIPIIKDSSANKCGVICSSMEIVACMICPSAEEFVRRKPQYVPQVIARLRELARQEATMLFTERNRDPSVSLPTLSERISFSILRVGSALDRALDQLDGGERHTLWTIVKEQLPPALFDEQADLSHLASGHASGPYPVGNGTAGAAANGDEGVHGAARLPWPYVKSCISSGLSSRLVYREGLAFVEGLPDQTLSDFALTYLQQEPRVRLLARQVAASGLTCASDVEELLLRGGVRAATIQHSPTKQTEWASPLPSPLPSPLKRGLRTLTEP